MDLLLHLKAALMGIVEGLTEFLPISSTGHLILAGEALDFNIESKAVFIVAIQAAAILAVCWEYRARLYKALRGVFNDKIEQRLAVNVTVAFIPAAVLGVLTKEAIEAALFSPVPVATAFFIGALIIFWVENRAEKPQYKIRVETIDDINWKDALKIGLLQCLALIPGTSRSGATIIGSLFIGLSRKAATEFSFFLAIPTITGASVYTLWKARDSLSIAADAPLYVTASITTFIAAFISVRWLLRYISTHSFRIFAWYRIAFGSFILLMFFMGMDTG